MLTMPPNLVPRVLWLFGQRMGASRDSGVLEFCYRKISAVKQWKSLQGSQSKNLNFFEFPRVSTGAHPLTKKPEDSGYEIGCHHEVSTSPSTLTKRSRALGTRLVPSTPQVSQNTVAHGSKKETTAPLSTGSKFMNRFSKSR